MTIAASENPIISASDGDSCTATYSSRRGFQCHVAVYDEGDGSFSAFALDLPGAVSYGGSVEEALAKMREALEGVLSSYLADGGIRWAKNAAWTPDVTLRVAEKWVVVNV